MPFVKQWSARGAADRNQSGDVRTTVPRATTRARAARINRAAPFSPRSGLGKRLEADRRRLGALFTGYAGEGGDSFDLHAFAVRAFELAPTDDIAYRVDHGCDGDESWGSRRDRQFDRTLNFAGA